MTLARQSVRETLRRRLQRTLTDAGISLVGRKVLVLCSGGADSVALVELLAGLSVGAQPAEMVVLQLDHSCRVQSIDEREAVNAVADRHGLTVVRRTRLSHEAAVSLDPSNKADSSPSHGDLRMWRYGQAYEVAVSQGCDVVAVGHHADDQLESVLMSITGAGASGGGLRGMRVARPLPGALSHAAPSSQVQLVRPMLTTGRAELVNFLQEQGLAWFEDPSNADFRYQRSRVRADVVPRILAALPDAGVALTRAARRAQDDRDALQELSRGWIARWGSQTELQIEALVALSAPAQRSVVSEWLRAHHLGREVSERNIAAIVELSGADPGARVMVPGGCVWRDRYVLRIEPVGPVNNLAGRT
jgi:tRNA(Ile)-lysidine synthetase-like protein